MKKILIAIPTARYIEPDTFKSIYDLKIPEGYETTFQCFYGYRVDQVRNLISDWVVRGFDYLFAVDHDVTFAEDTLCKMLSHNVDVVSGIYRQRVPEQKIEIYDMNQQRMNISQLAGRDLVQIGGCGFGCVLVKKEVLQTIGYPQFEYHVALDHSNTVSEDTDFCRKAMNKGFSLWCDPSILCGHIGSTTMTVQVPAVDPILQHFNSIRNQNLLPVEHSNYLSALKKDRVDPKVIYDIGANVLHWTDWARNVWPDARIIAFEAMDAVKSLYESADIESITGIVLGDREDTVEFYENIDFPAGNSIYRENSKFNPDAEVIFTDNHKVERKMIPLDSVRRAKSLPRPDLIKIDVQGAELAVLKGARKTLERCDDIILELQHEEYNIGAPKAKEVIEYLNSIGFEMVGGAPFCASNVDGDYHFTRTRPHL